MYTTDDATPPTASDDPPSAGARVADVFDRVLLYAARALAEQDNRLGFARLVIGLVERARFVRAEKVAEIVIRAVGSAACAAVDRMWEVLDAEALEALKGDE